MKTIAILFVLLVAGVMLARRAPTSPVAATPARASRADTAPTFAAAGSATPATSTITDAENEGATPDLQEDVARLIERFKAAGNDPAALRDARQSAVYVGPAGEPVLLDRLEGARDDDERSAIILALESLAPIHDVAKFIRALLAMRAGSPPRLQGAWLLVQANVETPFIRQAHAEASTILDDADAPAIAVQIVGKVGGRNAEPKLIEVARSDRPFEVRHSALMALACNGVSKAGALALGPMEDDPRLQAMAGAIRRGAR